ncbi:MAG: phytoene desaturase [Alkalicoccus sp.]|nr:MAG: phytoene desaturase [Alkalicoccus sp.]
MKTIIAGGGIGGMITALYENKSGNEVILFEKKSSTGGRLAYHRHGEYKVDEGPTVVLLPDMIKDILEELGLQSRVEMQRIDPLYPLHFPDGTTFLKWSSTEKQKEEISRLFPGEEKNFDKYMADMETRFTEGKEAFLTKAFLTRRSFWTPKNVKTLWKLRAYQSVRKQAAAYFRHPKLQDAFSLQTLYIGGSPSETPAIYSLVSFSEHAHGIWYVKGGYAGLAEVLTEAMEERGITVRTNSEVEALVTDGTRCTGVKVDEAVENADRVVLNGEFPLAEKLVREPSRSYKSSSGCLLFYFGLNEPLDTEHVHNFYMGENLDNHMNDVFKKYRLNRDPSFYVFNPSLIDSSLAPEGHGVAYVLVPVPAGRHITRKEYQDYATLIKRKLIEKVDINLELKTVWEHVRSPYEAKIDGLFSGGSFGLAPSMSQSGIFRPQVKPFAYNNVYAVGASVHPGGGIPVVMQGAKILSQVLKEDAAEQAAFQRDV